MPKLLHFTTDRHEILQWADSHGATPVRFVPSRHPPEDGDLSLLFPGEDPGVVVEQLPWSQWFDMFDERRLALAWSDDTAQDSPARREFLLQRRDRIPAQRDRTGG